jgi:hypothetical protein
MSVSKIELDEVSVVTVYKDNLNQVVMTGLSISELGFEWIVVNGGAKNNEKELRQLFGFDFLYINGPDSGIYDGMNRGVAAATKPWVWILNSGDLCVLTCGDSLYFKDKANLGMVLFKQFNLETKKVSKQNFSKFLLKTGLRPIPQQSIFFKKNPGDYHSWFWLEDGVSADQTMILRMLTRFRLVKSNKLIALFEGFGVGSLETPLDFSLNIRKKSSHLWKLLGALMYIARVIVRK